MVQALEAFATRLPGFSFVTCVAAPHTRHPQKGYVTQHMSAGLLNDGDIDM